jgi:hypothetical protein
MSVLSLSLGSEETGTGVPFPCVLREYGNQASVKGPAFSVASLSRTFTPSI